MKEFKYREGDEGSMKKMSPYECSFWKDEMMGYNWEVNVTHLERMQFVRMMIEREEGGKK